MRKTIFEEEAFRDFTEWAVFNKKVFDKINELLKDIKRTPFKGIGKPEPLKHKHTGYWSRRITDEHRLVYKISSENDVIIVSCRGHYK